MDINLSFCYNIIQYEHLHAIVWLCRKHVCVIEQVRDLNFLITGGELALLKHNDMVSDPLQQHGDQLIVLLPAQLQFLSHNTETYFTLHFNIQHLCQYFQSFFLV